MGKLYKSEDYLEKNKQLLKRPQKAKADFSTLFSG